MTLIWPPLSAEGAHLTAESLFCYDEEGKVDQDSCKEDTCLPRCEEYSYELTRLTSDEVDAGKLNGNVKLYFQSNEVETWTEYEEYNFDSFLSDVGGLVGLLMGLSIYGLTEMAFDFAEEGKDIVEKFLMGKRKRFVRKKTAKE